FNTMVSSSISSLLFNANPFLRFDAYYILSDYVEIPNLMESSQTFLKSKVKHLLFGIQLRLAQYTLVEKVILSSYGLISFIVRNIVMFSILMVILQFIAPAGISLMLLAACLYLLPMLFRFMKYLFSNRELYSQRRRAISVCLIPLLMLCWSFANIQAPHFSTLKARVVAQEKQVLFIKQNAVLQQTLANGSRVQQGDIILIAESKELQWELGTLSNNKKLIELHRDVALKNKNYHAAQVYAIQLRVLLEKEAVLKKNLNELSLTAQFDGVICAPDLRQMLHSNLHANTPFGELINPQQLRIKAFLNQNEISQYLIHKPHHVLIRHPANPTKVYSGKINQLKPAASKQHSSFNAERLFEIEIIPEPNFAQKILPGQTLQVKISYKPQSLWQTIKRQLAITLQQNFKL
ncbi:MAG: hypothetical protein HRT88_17225, partial [Lentisphaeraceae bacterium]|nr:hypothetical protein [Lentisphaeraceae bacterium]